MFNWLFGDSEPAVAPTNPPVAAIAMANDLAEALRKNRELDALADHYRKQRDMFRNALSDIAGMETPGSAHIGRKMAKRARRAMTAACVRLAMTAKPNGTTEAAASSQAGL